MLTDDQLREKRIFFTKKWSGRLPSEEASMLHFDLDVLISLYENHGLEHGRRLAISEAVGALEKLRRAE